MPDDNELLAGGARPRLTPVDVQQQQFKRAFRGYDEQEVDDFLDRVTEDIGIVLEENERLKEQARHAPTTPLEGAGDAADASRTVAEIKRSAEEEADGIIQDAHARADAIVREAEARGGAISRGAPPPPSSAGETGHLSRFVTRERSFLQELAGIIQSHAEGVKSMVQEARQAQTEAESSGPADEAVAAHRSREPFGPAGSSAGRDIEAADDAVAATAGTAEADQEAVIDSMTQPPESAPHLQDLDSGEAEPAEAEGRPAVIRVPEAPEDRTAQEAAWAEREGRIQQPAGAVAFGGAAAEREEDGEGRRPERGREPDKSLGDLFWGED